MSFPYLDETKALNESTRKEAAGSFNALTDGVTHYEISGDINNPAEVKPILLEFLQRKIT